MFLRIRIIRFVVVVVTAAAQIWRQEQLQHVRPSFSGRPPGEMGLHFCFSLRVRPISCRVSSGNVLPWMEICPGLASYYRGPLALVFHGHILLQMYLSLRGRERERERPRLHLNHQEALGFLIFRPPTELPRLKMDKDYHTPALSATGQSSARTLHL